MPSKKVPNPGACNAPGRKNPEHRTYDALNRWYTILPEHWPDGAVDRCDLARSLAGEGLTGHPRWDLPSDLAWFLLHGATRPLNPRAEKALVAFWETVPALGAWFRYLEAFPEGEFCEDYRMRRVRKAELALMRVHLPEQWLLGTVPLPDAAHKHVAGEWVCLECRAKLTRHAIRSATWENGARLRASSEVDTMEIPVIVDTPSGKANAMVTLAVDGDYLRLWVTPEHVDVAIPDIVRVVLSFGDQGVISADFDARRDSALGKNVGRLGPSRLQGLLALWVKTVVPSEVNHGASSR